MSSRSDVELASRPDHMNVKITRRQTFPDDGGPPRSVILLDDSSTQVLNRHPYFFAGVKETLGEIGSRLAAIKPNTHEPAVSITADKVLPLLGEVGDELPSLPGAASAAKE